MSLALMFLHNYCHWTQSRLAVDVCSINCAFQLIDPEKSLLGDFFNQCSVLGQMF